MNRVHQMKANLLPYWDVRLLLTTSPTLLLLLNHKITLCSYDYIYLVQVDFYRIHHIVVDRNQAQYCILFTPTRL